MKKKKRSKKRTSKSGAAGAGVKIGAQCFLVGVLLVLFCSCLSFDIADWPSPYAYPHNKPAENLCGKVGAFFAYYLLYYLGPGVFVLLGSAIFYILWRITGRRMGQMPFRLAGLAMLTIAMSVTYNSLWPDAIFSFPDGSGGIVGVGIGTFMRRQFGAVGMFILMAAMWAVGFLLLADTVVLALAGWIRAGAKRLAVNSGPVLTVLVKVGNQLSEFKEALMRTGGGKKPKKSGLILGGDLARAKAAHQEAQLSADHDSEIEKHVEQRQYEEPEEEIPEKPASKGPVVKAAKGPAAPKKPVVQPTYDDYVLPPLDILVTPQYSYTALQEKVVKDKAAALEGLLGEFNVNARVVAAETGPVVTMFELELGAGVKVSRINNLSNDMARALGVGAVRVVAPLPGKHTIGVEVPNSEKEKVRIKSMLEQAGDAHERMHLPLFLGKDSSGDALVSDLAKMPHLLIAGTTGSGKSVCINSIIVSMLLTKRPDEVKMILIDPKMVEMTAFNTIPHLMCPIVTETQMAVKILEWATVKMDERYAVLAEAKVKNIADFNKLGTEEILKRFEPSTPEEEAQIPKKLPYIVIIIDELADLMMTAAKEIEAYIVRLAQKSRAVGIHIVLATQRPQATVVTGLIKSNMPCRIGFRVAARMDSRIILDQNGAETLLGEGDMLFLKPGTSDLLRAQGTLIDEGEIRKIVKHLREIAEPQFHPELTQLRTIDVSEAQRDELFDAAVRIVLETRRGSVSLLQRRLSIGYARASRMIETMAASGILGEYKGSQAREVMMTVEEYEQLLEEMNNEAAGAYDDDDDDEMGDEASEPAYVTEGQREYMALEDEEDEED